MKTTKGAQQAPATGAQQAQVQAAPTKGAQQAQAQAKGAQQAQVQAAPTKGAQQAQGAPITYADFYKYFSNSKKEATKDEAKKVYLCKEAIRLNTDAYIKTIQNTSQISNIAYNIETSAFMMMKLFGKETHRTFGVNLYSTFCGVAVHSINNPVSNGIISLAKFMNYCHNFTNNVIIRDSMADQKTFIIKNLVGIIAFVSCKDLFLSSPQFYRETELLQNKGRNTESTILRLKHYNDTNFINIKQFMCIVADLAWRIYIILQEPEQMKEKDFLIAPEELISASPNSYLKYRYLNYIVQVTCAASLQFAYNNNNNNKNIAEFLSIPELPKNAQLQTEESRYNWFSTSVQQFKDSNIERCLSDMRNLLLFSKRDFNNTTFYPPPPKSSPNNLTLPFTSTTSTTQATSSSSTPNLIPSISLPPNNSIKSQNTSAPPSEPPPSAPPSAPPPSAHPSNISKSEPEVGGKYTKSTQRVQLGGRTAVVYEGRRGAKYVKKGGEFVTLKKALKEQEKKQKPKKK